MDKKRFEALDALRGFCALFVVVFHTHLIGSVTELSFFRGSSVFVEFFFVLSGFVLMHSYGYKNNISFYKSMRSRFFRLYPLHLFMLIVFISLELFKLFIYKYNGMIFDGMPFSGRNSLNEIIPNILLIQSWTPYTNALSLNYPSWSISIEFYVYFLFFLSLFYFRSYRLFTWLSLILISFCFIYIDFDFPTASALSGVFCFFGGVLTYTLYNKIKYFKSNYIVSSCVEMAIILSIFLVIQLGLYNENIIFKFLFFLAVLVFSFESGFLSNIFKINIFQHMGKLSYSIYMVHAAVLFIFLYFFIFLQKTTSIDLVVIVAGMPSLDFGSVYLNNFILICILLIVVFVSKFTYKYVELKGQSFR